MVHLDIAVQTPCVCLIGDSLKASGGLGVSVQVGTDASQFADEYNKHSITRYYYQCTGVANGMRGSKSSFSGCFCTAPFEKKLQLLI